MSTLPVVIREEYLALVDGNHCAAAILNAFEMWSKNKCIFIYKSAAQMQADLMGLFGKNRIGAAFLELRRRGFLVARNNPAIPTDQTLQYQFQKSAILCAMLFSLPVHLMTGLKVQALKLISQTLILKSQRLRLKHESEYISESKTESKSELDSRSNFDERDFQPEGIDPKKFLGDDPTADPDAAPPYLREQMPSEAVRQQLATHTQRLGLKTYAEVVSRCANARSWEYVLKALVNEPAPYPPVPPPPPSRLESDDVTQPDYATESDADATPDSDVPVVVQVDLKPAFELSAETILPEPMKWWAVAYSQLEIQLDRASFETFFRNNVTLVAVEGEVWRFKVGGSYAQNMLQHRLYREVRRVLSDVIGCDKEAITLVFEVAEAVKS